MTAEVLPTLLVHSAHEAEEKLHALSGYSGWVQVDVIDGLFARNTTLATDEYPDLLRSYSLEVQLMVKDPLPFIQEWYQYGVGRIIIHLESHADILECIRAVRKLKLEVGVGIAPATPLGQLAPFAADIDRILLLGVDPGFEGQTFQHETFSRIAELHGSYPLIPIEVDGGITPDVALQAYRAGATSFAVNSYLFSSSDPLSALQTIGKALKL